MWIKGVFNGMFTVWIQFLLFFMKGKMRKLPH